MQAQMLTKHILIAGQRGRDRQFPARGSVTGNWAQRQPSQSFWGMPLHDTWALLSCSSWPDV